MQPDDFFLLLLSGNHHFHHFFQRHLRTVVDLTVLLTILKKLRIYQ